MPNIAEPTALPPTSSDEPGLPDFQPFAAFGTELADPSSLPSPLRAAVTEAHRRPEPEAVAWLHAQLVHGAAGTPDITAFASRLVEQVRTRRSRASGVDALMHEFSLSSEEGVALMCLAEALLRIPDAATADRLIADKVSQGDWASHLGGSPSLFVNAATWGLLVTGKLVGTRSEQGLGAALTRLIARGGEPLIRKGVDLAMRMLGNQFVTGRTIAEALANSREREARGYRFSYDMLGEAALTMEDADRYFTAYEEAIHAIGRAADGRGIHDGPGISVKLSALHPRYARAQRARVLAELGPRLAQLARLARRYGIGINIDAEEADRLELSLDLLEALAFDAELEGFDGIGFVVQAYQKRCPAVIDWLADLAQRSKHRFMVRLVKGAYWDAEIKRAQADGMPDYPVYTRKCHTDMSYLVCARKLLEHADRLYPQFATHNAHSLAAIHTWARERGVSAYEFQCLHGMGETLYDQVVGTPVGKQDGVPLSCRIYAPVGSHQTLLAYLVRRLLENGANSSFVNRIVDDKVSIASLVADPFAVAEAFGGTPHHRIPLPTMLFAASKDKQAGRRNSAGIDLSDESVLRRLHGELATLGMRQWQAQAIVAPGIPDDGHPIAPQSILNPADSRDRVGTVIEADARIVDAAVGAAMTGFEDWQAVSREERAAMLERAADLFEIHHAELMALAVREAGKSLPNAVAEVREAVDFLRYYAMHARAMEHAPGLGPVVCISPWNFPLAIFTGEVSAALAAGNTVLAKPAEQTPLIAQRAVQLLHEAGVPRAALQFLPGRGETVGAALTADTRVRGVIFTGSTEVAQLINRTLAARAGGEEIPFIAETGGQNAMIIDSTALPEQVVQDAIASAFDSAGQRCSALRVLCLQEDIADRTIAMLRGAMRELQIGSPDRLSTDVGPVIDADAQRGLEAHIERMQSRARAMFRLPLPDAAALGTFVAPTLFEIDSLADLTREVFGPVLHVLRYRRNELPKLIAAIHATGYGLTFGVHSRIDETITQLSCQVKAGNVYVNRNIVGAVVGVQPFGGEGKSGTGPKAGGPLYLQRLRKNAGDDAAVRVLGIGGEVVHTDAGARVELQLLQAWAASSGESLLAQVAQAYLRTDWRKLAVALPGPTGERNSLRFVPRGRVYCRAASRAALLEQLAATIASGNAAVIDRSTAEAFSAGLPDFLRENLHITNGADDEHQEFDAALADAVSMPVVRLALARRTDRIVPLIEAGQGRPLALWRLFAERALCINTTAAGGNASLMALQD